MSLLRWTYRALPLLAALVVGGCQGPLSEPVNPFHSSFQTLPLGVTVQGGKVVVAAVPGTVAQLPALAGQPWVVRYTLTGPACEQVSARGEACGTRSVEAAADGSAEFDVRWPRGEKRVSFELLVGTAPQERLVASASVQSSDFDGDGAAADCDDTVSDVGDCSDGYACRETGAQNPATCEDRDECQETPNGGCDPRARCLNTPGSFSCECLPGYTLEGGRCVDVDECATGTAGCDVNAVCTNLLGSSACVCNAGFLGDGKTCVDEDECTANNGGCAAQATCTNTVGSRTCACAPGFEGDGVSCVDVNECAVDNGGCDALARCANVPGSFTCTCPSGYDGDGRTCVDRDECVLNPSVCGAGQCTNAPGAYTCACPAGYVVRGGTCVDVNECTANPGVCGTGGACTNTNGAYTCACQRGFGFNGTTCADVDECAQTPGVCGSGTCANTNGAYTCACNGGYQSSTSSGVTTCVNVNECAANSSLCGAAGAGTCTDTPGSYTCACNTGYAFDGAKCANVNECAANSAVCGAGGVACQDKTPGYTCVCATGYSFDGTTCQVSSPCAINNGGCDANATCAVSGNAPVCTCKSGFTGNGRTCTDVNECQTNNGGCDVNATCINAPGSFACDCADGYVGDGRTCTCASDACRCPAGMAYIPGGTFAMGAAPGRSTTVAAYCIDKTEVTLGAYGSNPCQTAATVDHEGTATTEAKSRGPTHPVSCVTWSEAGAFCSSRGGSLPTEAQWEFAARGTTGRTYPWGEQAPGASLANYNPQGVSLAQIGTLATKPVGSYPAGDSAFGLSDMGGNVWEWVADVYSVDASGATYVIRGGSYFSPNFTLAAIRRDSTPQNKKYATHGFRCVSAPR